MQDPLKSNKAFKESYLSYQAHKRFLTPYNVDTLVTSLHQIREQAFSSPKDRRLRSQDCGFVDSYLQSTLPTVTHKPLVAEVKPWMKLSSNPPHLIAKTERKPLRTEAHWKEPSTSVEGKRFEKLHPTDHKFRPEMYRLLEIPALEPSIVQSLMTKPSRLEAMLAKRGSLPDDNSSIKNEIESDESDSGWQEEEDELMSDVEEDGPRCESISSRETWELESIDGESQETDSGHFHSSLSPLHEAVEISPSMIPHRLTYPGEIEGGISPGLTPSLFPNLPPTIHFPLPDENYESLSSRQKTSLKWKPSTITPNVIKHTLAKVGFTYITKGSDWVGYWGRHMKPEGFRTIQPHQKVNHLPGSFQLGRKDKLWRNLSRMQAHHGRKDFDFVPQTFVLPSDMRQFKRVWEERETHRQKWIIKPPASARGIGIQVVHKWSQIPKKRPIVVQQYLSEPYLINDSKFDLRVYVYVSCIDPLTIYIYRDGLVRFATRKYSQSTRTLSNRFVHLTNYSINKKNVDFKANSDETQCFGHKWGLLALWEYMDKKLGVDPHPVWTKIKDLVVKTILSCEGYIASLVKANCRESSVIYELFGFDIMLDKHLKPWLLEVNVSPSLHSNSRLDFNIKGHMIRDLFNMVGFHLPSQISCSTVVGVSRILTSRERSKHSYYSRLTPQQEPERRNILQDITLHDYRVLTRFIDEQRRRGGFIPIHPTLDTVGQYRHYFQYERYNNMLIEEWLKQYSKRVDKGIELLRDAVMN